MTDARGSRTDEGGAVIGLPGEGWSFWLWMGRKEED
jgi:hypothetical protein